jgi:hydroxymethylglutaryl-CoA lyase
VPTERKLAFIRALADAGLRHIEATSFVNPKAVPQLADALEVAQALPPSPGVTYSALVPNDKGLDRAIEAGIKRIAVFTAASETFTQKNIRMSIDESLRTFEPVVQRAKSAGMTARGYVSTCFVCPYEGEISKEKVLDVTQRLLALGVDEVAISDTIGAAAPTDVDRTVGFVLQHIPATKIALHFHDTYGTALANVVAGLQLGITTFDSSAGGLGGCPFAPGAAGNVATEDLVYLLERMGIATGVNIEKTVAAADIMAAALQRPLTSRQWRRLSKNAPTQKCQ